MGFEYPPQPNVAAAAARVKPPAITLIVIAGMGVLGELVRMAGFMRRMMELPLDTPPELARIAHMASGPLGMVGLLMSLAVSGFIIFGAIKMMNLQSYGLAMAVSIVAVIPCLAPCCCLSIPAGIWSIVVLSNAEVKAAFR